MTQWLLGLDLVVISATTSLAQHIPILDQLGENLVGAALGDADRSSDVTQADPGIPSDTEQDVGMVREEVPSGRRLGRCRYYLTYISRKIIHELMIQSSLLTSPLEHKESSRLRSERGLRRNGLCGGDSVVESAEGPLEATHGQDRRHAPSSVTDSTFYAYAHAGRSARAEASNDQLQETELRGAGSSAPRMEA